MSQRTYPQAGYLQPNYSSTNSITCSVQSINILYKKNLPLENRYQIHSPYTNEKLVNGGNVAGPSQYQLNMRRKAEILQYKNNSSNNAKLTKAQSFSQSMRGNTKRNNINNSSDCFSATPSTSSGIPGPLTFLKFDNSIPLYMYNESNPLSISDEKIQLPTWNVSTEQDIFIPYDTLTNFFSLYIHVVENTFTTFNFQFPVSLYLQGTNATPIIESTDFKVDQFDFKVLFDKQPLNITFDSNFNTLENNYISVSDASGDFFAIQYIGMLSITNLRLPTQYGFVYDFAFNFVTSNINIPGYTKGVFINSSGPAQSSLNCNIISNHSSANFQQLLIEEI